MGVERQAAQLTQFDPGRLVGLDQVFATIAEQAPGFAGFYYEEETRGQVDHGHMVVLVSDPSEKDAAVAAVRSYKGGIYLTQGAGRPRAIEVQTVPFSFLQLARWKVMAEKEVGRAAFGYDLDERANKVLIAVDSPSRVASVAKLTNRLGIPSPAVAIRVEKPIKLTTELTDVVRPLTGGLQAGDVHSTCSLGFMATLTDSTHGFFTASHCTETSFQDDAADTFYQNMPNFEVGKEYEDVSRVSGGDSVYSDAAFISVDGFLPDSDWAFTVATTSGGDTIDSAHPTWPVGGDGIGLAPVSGQVIDKVGRTTGDTWGTVDRTCADYAAGTDVTRLCDDRVFWSSTLGSPLPMVGGGDSGSPAYGFIYDENGQNTDSVRVWGIVWAKQLVGDSAFWFSDIDGMTNDFDNIARTH